MTTEFILKNTEEVLLQPYKYGFLKLNFPVIKPGILAIVRECQDTPEHIKFKIKFLTGSGQLTYFKVFVTRGFILKVDQIIGQLLLVQLLTITPELTPIEASEENTQ